MMKMKRIGKAILINAIILISSIGLLFSGSLQLVGLAVLMLYVGYVVYKLVDAIPDDFYALVLYGVLWVYGKLTGR